VAIDPTASLKNINSSIRQYYSEQIETNLGIPVYFDKNIFDPDGETDKWITFKFLDNEIKPLSFIPIEAIVCTRGDTQGIECEGLRDIVVNVSTDTSEFANIRRIHLYDFDQNPLVKISAIRIDNSFPCSGVMDGPQGIKFMKLNITLRTPSLV
jgi:hypothetical protein